MYFYLKYHIIQHCIYLLLLYMYSLIKLLVKSLVTYFLY